MILVMTTDGPTLVDPDEVGAFSVRIEEGADLGGITSAGDGEVFVPAALVERLGPGPGFRAMLRAVEKYGWFDPETDLIRAHVDKS